MYETTRETQAILTSSYNVSGICWFFALLLCAELTADCSFCFIWCCNHKETPLGTVPFQARKAIWNPYKANICFPWAGDTELNEYMAIAGYGSHQAISSTKGRILIQFEEWKSKYWGFILTYGSVQSCSLHYRHHNLRKNTCFPCCLPRTTPVTRQCSVSWLTMVYSCFGRCFWGELQAHSVSPGKSNINFRILPWTLNLLLASRQERLWGNDLQNLQILVFYSAITLAIWTHSVSNHRRLGIYSSV